MMIATRYYFLFFIFITIFLSFTCNNNTANHIDKELYYSMSHKQFLKYTRDNISEENIRDKEGKNISLEFRKSFYFSIPFDELMIDDNWLLNAKFFYIKIDKDLNMTGYCKLGNLKKKIEYTKNDFNKYHPVIEYYMNKETDNKEIN